MEGDKGFFSIPVTEEFVASMDDTTLMQLTQILRRNFLSQYARLEEQERMVAEIEGQINFGEENISRLKEIRLQHKAKQDKLRKELDKVQEELNGFKRQLREG